LPRPPGPDGEPVSTLRSSSRATGDLPPVQAAITAPRALGAPMAAVRVDSPVVG